MIRRTLMVVATAVPLAVHAQAPKPPQAQITVGPNVQVSQARATIPQQAWTAPDPGDGRAPSRRQVTRLQARHCRTTAVSAAET